MREIKAYSIAIFLSLAVPSIATARPTLRECQDAFSVEATQEPHAPTSLDFAKGLTPQVDWESWHLAKSQTRLSSPDSHGGSWFYEEASFETDVEHGDKKSSAFYLRYDKQKDQAPEQPQRLSSSGRLGLQKFEAVKNKALNFVIAAYQSRRLHWGPEFLTKLRKLADEWKFESAYLVSEANDFSVRPNRIRGNAEYHASGLRFDLDMLGTMRLIHERDGKLPMEDYLGIEIESPSGALKVEPGNFAIAHEANEIATIDISIQILAHISRYKSDFEREPFFLTYADPYSEKLYGMLGFKFAPLSMIKPVGSKPEDITVDDKGVVRVIKNDVAWAPMYASEEMMTTLLKEKLSRLAVKRDRASQAHFATLNQKFNLAVEQSSKALLSPPTEFLGAAKDRVGGTKVKSAKLTVARDPKRKEATLHIRLSDEHHARARYSIRIPYPIPEGYVGESVAGTTVRYQNGVLSETWNSGSGATRSHESQTIKIDPYLRIPKWGRVVEINGSASTTDVEIRF